MANVTDLHTLGGFYVETSRSKIDGTGDRPLQQGGLYIYYTARRWPRYYCFNGGRDFYRLSLVPSKRIRPAGKSVEVCC